MAQEMTQDMKQKLTLLKEEAEKSILESGSSKDLEALKIHFLGKKGALTDILKGVGQLTPEERPQIGQMANAIKQGLTSLLEKRSTELSVRELEESLSSDDTDTTLPGTRIGLGQKHPINKVIDEICEIFGQLGFSVIEGPDIETDYYNFEALNIPGDHPARDMHDTFYLNTGHLMRTHTSPVQIRTMEKEAPPLKIIVPGKVYRVDADTSHSPVFHQIEGLFVDENVTFSELKGALSFFLQALFGTKKKVRFRPSYFPFTEPSTEVDVECVTCSGSGCRLCKKTGWLEILGAGMVHPNVFKSVGYDTEKVKGFAFGMGIERIAMLKYAIDDIRLFYENDLRFLKQF
jgi:phenylalanyl-tRNA synthetase alpha chain